MTFSKEQVKTFFNAVRNGQEEVVADFVNQGFDVTGWYDTPTGDHVLQIACRKGFLNIAKLLLEKGNADPNHPNFNRETALHLAVQAGSLEIVKLLLDHQAALNLRDKEGRTALHTAVNHEQQEMVETLVRAGAAVDILDNWDSSALFEAETDEMLDVLLSTPHPLNHAPVCRNALFTASKYGYDHLVERLLKRGLNPNMVSRNKQTPLLAAAERGYSPIVVLLIKAGAYLNATNLQGQTALLLACKNKHKLTAKQLLSAQAALDIADNDGKLAADYIRENGWTDLLPS